MLIGWFETRTEVRFITPRGVRVARQVDIGTTGVYRQGMSTSDDRQSYSQGQVSNEPIFPMGESMKLYGALTVLLKNSNVARGHPPVRDEQFVFCLLS